MPTTTLPAFSPFRRTIVSNPFYLLSACCMLGGCLALTNSLSWTSIPLPRLLLLIATLNVYEAALIGLAAFLALRRDLQRDAVMLLVLEAFFLADVTFLNAEAATARLGLGIAIDALLFIAAAIKLSLALRVLGLRQSRAHFIFILMQLAAILAIPLILPRIDHGTVAAIWFYGGWWLAAALLASYEMLARLFAPPPSDSLPSPAAARVYLSIPWLSLVAHLGILHYVYQADYFGADAAPMLLALALVLQRISQMTAMPRGDLLLLRLLLPIAAIVVSAGNPRPLIFALGHGRIAITPLYLAVAGAYVIYIYGFLRAHWLPAIVAGCATALAAILGPTPAQIMNGANDLWNWCCDFAWKLTPKTLPAWGAIAVSAAFAFLGLGAAVSLHRKPDVATNPADENISA